MFESLPAGALTVRATSDDKLALAKQFGWKIGDTIPLQATIFSRPDRRAWEFNISGIYDSPVKGTCPVSIS